AQLRLPFHARDRLRGREDRGFGKAGLPLAYAEIVERVGRDQRADRAVLREIVEHAGLDAPRRAHDDEARLAADGKRIGHARPERILAGEDRRASVEYLPAVRGRFHGATVVDSGGT